LIDIFIKSLTSFLILSLCLAVNAAEKKMDTSLSKILLSNSFSAEFIQKTEDRISTRSIEGKLSIKRNGKFRVEYYEPLNELLISNGLELIRYDRDLEQVDISPLDNLLQETPLGLFSLKKEELLKRYKFTGCVTDDEIKACELEPYLKDDYLKKLIISIKSNTLSSLYFVDLFDQEVELIFKNVSFIDIQDTDFSFDIPAGIDVVRH
tara:strand:+ start:45 stop:668 length:624 start_codon:yes stop_codon:yes gene_type:complete